MNSPTPQAAWPNPERRVARSAGIFTLMAVLTIFVPGLLGIDGMEGGFAISFVAFFLAVTGLVVTIMFRRRAADVDRLLAGTGLLAHWQYPAELWRQYVAEETVARHGANLGLALIVGAWAIPLGLLFWLFDHEAGWIVFVVMLGVTALVALVAWAFPLIWQARRRFRPAEAWIGERAAFFDGTLFRWDGFGSRLDEVTLRPAEDANPPLLHVRLSTLTRVGWQPYDLRMPVPEGRWSEAQQVLDILSIPKSKAS